MSNVKGTKKQRSKIETTSAVLPTLRALHARYSPGVVWVKTTDSGGRSGIGTAFHVGDGIFVTARHVVQDDRGGVVPTISVGINRHWFEPDEEGLGTLRYVDGGEIRVTMHPSGTWTPKSVHVASGQHADVALLVVPEASHLPILPLGDHLDDWLGEEMVLHRVLMMGYPPVPFAIEPYPVSATAEINCIIDKRTGGHPHFIVSSTARGGFSGGPVVSEYNFVVGLVTESLKKRGLPTELGFLAVLTVEPIYVCMSEHDLVPRHIDEAWEGFWTDKRTEAEKDAELIEKGWTITKGENWKSYSPPPKAKKPKPKRREIPKRTKR